MVLRIEMFLVLFTAWVYLFNVRLIPDNGSLRLPVDELDSDWSTKS